jgi:hypothetical protein
MDYAEALKTITAQKIKDNLMVIKLNYDTKLVLPFKAGVAFMESLTNAEIFSEPYNEQHTITEYNKNTIHISVMSHAEYIRIKVAALLGVKADDLLKTNYTEITT